MKKILVLGIGTLALIGFIVFFGVFSIGSFFMIFQSDEEVENVEGYEGTGYACKENKELDKATFENTFSSKGVLSGHADDYIDVSKKYNLDPVLLASISFLETANGTSEAVVKKNNTGGLMGANGLMTFDSIRASVEVQALSIANRIKEIVASKGEYKLEYLRDVYAPLGAANDPNNLNANWLPNVITYATALGGFTMNCEASDDYSQYGSLKVNGEVGSPLGHELTVASPFGNRGYDPVTGAKEDLHRGTDYACTKDEPIYAIMDGVVQTAVFHYSWGNYVQIVHNDGTGSLYGHMTKFIVTSGTKVKVGQQIGTCGSTGNSTGNHLHLEFTKNGKNYFDTSQLIDSNKFLVSALSKDTKKDDKKKK